MWFISSAEVDGEMLPGLPCLFSASSLKKKIIIHFLITLSSCIVPF